MFGMIPTTQYGFLLSTEIFDLRSSMLEHSNSYIQSALN